MNIIFVIWLLLVTGLFGYIVGVRSRELTEVGEFVWEYYITDYIEKHIEWSRKTFGPPHLQDSERLCRHIEKELDEIRRNPMECEEWADVIILALDGAYRSGHSPSMIATVLHQKQQKNMSRTWVIPTDPTTPIEHHRAEERETNP